MLDALLIVVGVLMAGIGFAFVLSAGSSQIEIAKVAPEYASRLFTSGVEAFASRTPVRFGVLFGEPIPEPARVWVTPIRVLAGSFLALFVAFALCIVFAIEK